MLRTEFFLTPFVLCTSSSAEWSTIAFTWISHACSHRLTKVAAATAAERAHLLCASTQFSLAWNCKLQPQIAMHLASQPKMRSRAPGKRVVDGWRRSGNGKFFARQTKSENRRCAHNAETERQKKTKRQIENDNPIYTLFSWHFERARSGADNNPLHLSHWNSALTAFQVRTTAVARLAVFIEFSCSYRDAISIENGHLAFDFMQSQFEILITPIGYRPSNRKIK